MKKIILVTLTALISACASTDTLSRDEKNVAYEAYITANKLDKVKHIRTFTMRNWQSLTNDYLVLSTSFKKHYLLQTKGQCYDLEHARILLTHQSTSGRFSVNFDSISVSSSPEFKCYIKYIYPISKEQSKELQAIGKVRKAENK